MARNNGCDLVYNYKKDKNFAEYVNDFTKGQGVDVVYDSLGGKYTNSLIDILGNYGLLVNYGNTDGYNINLDVDLLRKGNKFLLAVIFRSYWIKKYIIVK